MRVQALRAVALAVIVAGLSAGAVPASSAAAGKSAGPDSTAGTTWYVDLTAQNCSDSGPGTLATPLCTLQAGADAAAPGDTVAIAASVEGVSQPYETVTVHHSGTATAPITFEPYGGPYFGWAGGNAQGGFSFVLDSVSNIVIRGNVGTGGTAVSINNSTGIVIQDAVIWTDTDNAVGVKVTGSSSVTIERSQLGGTTPTSQAVYLGPGSVGVVRDNVFPQTGYGIVADDTAAGTSIVANTIDEACGPTIEVTGSDAHADVENNVVENLYLNPSENISCSLGGVPRGIEIDAGTATGVTENYNTVANDKGLTPPYVWNGVYYKTLAAYQAASGQGASDIVESTIAFGFITLPNDPGVIGVANPSAPGQPAVDYYGESPVGATPDRGAIQYQTATTQTLEVTGVRAQTVSADLDLHGIPWGTSASVTFDWGDGATFTAPDQSSADAFLDYRRYYQGTHTYKQAGTYTVTATLTDGAGTFTQTETITTGGSTYVPVTPSRVLDTRYGTGAPKAAVGPGSTVSLNVVNGVSGAPATGMITAVVLNVTVTAPTTGGYITAYPAGRTRPTSSVLDFAGGETVANLVTLRTGTNGQINLYNGSGGTAQLIADVEGYYVTGPSASGYIPVTPQRLLDTRQGIGAAKHSLGASGTLALTVSGVGPVPASGVTAVALNITETAPTTSGYLTVWPDGVAKPLASNLDFAANDTVPNLVIVAVPPDGKIDIYNGSGGSVQVLADVEGYYTSSGDAFVPLNPVRDLDTRVPIGALTPGASQVTNWTDTVPAFRYSEALVANLTATQPATGGYVTAYPAAAVRPTASNLDFASGQTVANLVMVGTAQGTPAGVGLYNGSGGTVELVGDLFGYFS